MTYDEDDIWMCPVQKGGFEFREIEKENRKEEDEI